MTTNDLLDFRSRFHLTQKAAADALGCSPRAISNWEKGNTSIPDYIALAASAFAMKLPKYGSIKTI